MESALSKKLYDLAEPTAYTSSSQLKKNNNFDTKDVQKWAETQDVLTKFGPNRKRFKRRYVYSNGPGEIYSADLADMRKFSRFNKGHTFALIVVDNFSRRLWVFPLKNKRPDSVISAFDQLFEKHQPKIAIHTDLGTFQIYSTQIYLILIIHL